MLRIHFTPEDLTRVRVAPGPDLLWEISNSVQTLQRRDGERVFGAWRRWARPRLPESRELLSPLLPPYGYSPDFLTPSAGERPTFRAAVEALLGTEPARLRAELARLARSARLPVWAASLARGDTETLTRLGDALHAYQARALVPHWRQIRADVEADRARRLRDLMDGGTEALLSGLGPDARWRPPVLEVTYPVEHCLRLEGRGLVLQP
ncbi:transcriptional regulator, partial [Streptomyces albidoflavus]